MPDPLVVTKNEKTIEQEEAMNKVVQKALKKRKARKKRAYDKLATMAPSVARIMQNTQYGAAAGGFKPSVRTDTNNGWSSSKVTHEKRSASARWPGIYKRALGGTLAAGAAGAVPGALIGAGLGGAGGAAYGAISPGEDEAGNKRSAIVEAIKRGLMGAGAGGLAGAGIGGLGGVGAAGGLRDAMRGQVGDASPLTQAIIGALLGGSAGALGGAGYGALTEKPDDDSAITRNALRGAGIGAGLGGAGGAAHAYGQNLPTALMRSLADDASPLYGGRGY